MEVENVGIVKSAIGVVGANTPHILSSLLKRMIVTDKHLCFSAKGIASKMGDSYRVYDKKEKTMVRLHEDMVIENIDVFVRLETRKSLIKVGDMIVQDEVYYFVTDPKSNNGVACVNIQEGKVEVLLPTTDVLGYSRYTKVYSAVTVLGGYEFLKRTHGGILAIITALWKNRNNLREYIETEGSDMIMPFVTTTLNQKGNSISKKHGSKIAMVAAVCGIGYLNRKEFGLEKLAEIKVTKRKVAILGTLVSAGLIGYLVTNKKFVARMRNQAIKNTIVSKLTIAKEFVLSKLKRKKETTIDEV